MNAATIWMIAAFACAAVYRWAYGYWRNRAQRLDRILVRILHADPDTQRELLDELHRALHADPKGPFPTDERLSTTRLKDRNR